MNREPKALALAFKRAQGKSKKIRELGIYQNMVEAEIDALIISLTDAKLAEDTELDRAKVIKGQRWYVEDLVKYSAMKPQEKLDFEYEHAFPETATEDEMLAKLDELS